MPRIAVIGLGAVGKIHVANLIAHREAELSAICDSQPEALQAISGKTSARATSNAAELPGTRPDAVIISSPTATHGEIVRECAPAGVPCLCEKPLAQDIRSAAAIVASIEESGLFCRHGVEPQIPSSVRGFAGRGFGRRDWAVRVALFHVQKH